LALVVLVSVLAWSPRPAEAAKPLETSVYQSLPSGKALIVAGNADEYTFYDNNFTTIEDGIYTLSGESFMPNVGGWVHVFGTCWQEKTNFVILTLHGDQALLLAEAETDVFTFGAVIHAQNFTLTARNLYNQYNRLWCEVVIEKVK